MAIQKMRESLNTFLYDSQTMVRNALRIMTFLGGITAIGIMIHYHGFSHTLEQKENLLEYIKAIFAIFIINYTVRFFYSFEPRQFLKETWFQAIIVLLLIVDVVSYYLVGFPLLEWTFSTLGIPNFTTFYILFIQVYMLLLIVIEASKISKLFYSIKIQPAVLFVLSFLILIGVGTGLLLLPEMVSVPGSMKFINALFTSVSASCVTGLIVVETSTFFTFKGHVVLLILIQLGGVGILSFATFFATFLKRGIGIRHQTVIPELMSEDSLYNMMQLLKQILFYAFTIELIGCILMFALWDPSVPFSSLNHKIFFTVFHSVSAFTNAGFTLFTGGLNNPMISNGYVLHIVFAILIIFGALGFPAMKDLFGVSNLRIRLKQPWRRWKTSTQIAVNAAIVLTILGTIMFYLLERNNLLGDKNIVEGVIISIFQSITRTAGFSTVDIGSLAMPTIVLFLFLMFIGGASGSMTGGIKTSTFVVLMLSVISTIKGKKEVEFGRKSISNQLLYQAFSIFLFACGFILFFIFLLTITEKGVGFMQIAFEEVSAFCTVGLSMGLTFDLSYAGKIVIMVSMFMGRVGILTLAFALSSPVLSTAYKYPKTNIMVG